MYPRGAPPALFCSYSLTSLKYSITFDTDSSFIETLYSNTCKVLEIMSNWLTTFSRVWANSSLVPELCYYSKALASDPGPMGTALDL